VTVEEELRLEVERSHAALDRIYRYLVQLEPTLTKEQFLLCPTDTCKWRKHPEWEERFEYLSSPEGKAAEEVQFNARVALLKIAFGSHFGEDGRPLGPGDR
jgi:hypothetical protein